MTQFTDFALHSDLLKSLEKVNFTTPTQIQAEFIPLALKGHDVMASAQTGSGKTAAFLLPAFQKFLDEKPDPTKLKRRKKGVRILVLTPTRELAEQVMKVATDLRAFAKISVKSVTGGVPIMKHKRMLRGKVDVLVATPGRLIDLMQQGDLHLQDVDTFILDEADRMLDMGFSKDVLKISRAIPPKRQTMLLSATLEGRVESVINEIMKEPKSIELANDTTRHENITQTQYKASDIGHKFEILKKLAEEPGIYQAVVFTNTKSMTEKIARTLKEMNEKVDFLHGDMRQGARNVSIKKMQAGQIRWLIATDVAARGLDIKDLTHVVNFDLPIQSEDYIHRIGRVGRGGSSGDAINIVSNDQRNLLRGIEKLTGQTAEVKVIEGLEYTPKPSKGPKKPKGKRSASAAGSGRFKRGNTSQFEEQKRRESTNKRKKRLPEAELSTGKKSGAKVKFSRSQVSSIEEKAKPKRSFKTKDLSAQPSKAKVKGKMKNNAFKGKSKGPRKGFGASPR